MDDVLSILKDYNIGYALWNFRGSFGVLDSGRADATYQDFHGHKLDHKLLSLLQEY
jgi:endoglucanase